MPTHSDDWVLLLAENTERAAWQKILAQAGYHTLEADSSVQALAYLRCSSHALVVLLDAPHLPLLNVVVPDRRIARHHAYLVIGAHGDTYLARVARLLDQISLQALSSPISAHALLDAVARACRQLAPHSLYEVTAGSLQTSEHVTRA